MSLIGNAYLKYIILGDTWIIYITGNSEYSLTIETYVKIFKIDINKIQVQVMNPTKNEQVFTLILSWNMIIVVVIVCEWY